MNYSIVLYILGCVLKFESAFLILPALVGLIYREHASVSYLAVAVLCLILGVLLTHKKPRSTNLYTREGFVAVALSWIIMSIFGAIPFVLTGDIPFYVDALFETISGFTTTGSSILTDVESISKASLFWRSFSHWIGGMGVFVFIMAILPMMGGSTMNLMKAESPGPSVSKLVPHVKDTAKILYGIYIAITICEATILRALGMPLFDSLTTTFGTVGTGGFGIRNDSIAGYSPAIQITITVFMILSGINYTAYFYILTGKIKELFKIEEVRWYLAIIFGSVAVITWNVRSLYPTFSETLRHAFFQVGSIITTTGYATTDFDLWPALSKTLLVTLMFIGACAGSTSGGIKVSRILILLKTIRKELSLIIHPRQVKKIRMDGHPVDHETLRSANVFLVVYFVLLLTSMLLISVDEFDFSTNFTSVVTVLNNIGPGLNLVGPTQNFSIFSPFSKFVLMFDMLAGRLELFPMMILLMPSTWKRK
ncbi:TrkH family potassium uptake protein [Roseburia intestinalis]|uniref:Cation transport protein n=1 Tax=Roseburia intestinalis L1-82 TaxID=536231 RepID=C7GD08_9FIRM|nr:TrkH family potassium uptake protein [Roseburia intestinalis]EEV00315.1 cation transport protein [Roseburia intestinalis L1-82]UWP55169.1 TrkH family potassium uptake protein [Roseburia intestinalis]VCV23706.1 Trk system potassium uptake protein TrkH [Roseburia intestinalis L1-82]